MGPIGIALRFHWLIALISLVMTVSASAQTLSVGVTPDCDVQIDSDLSTEPLNRAIEALSSDGGQTAFGLALPELSGDLVIDQRNVALMGGFQNCNEASQAVLNGVVIDRGSKTTIRGSGRNSVIRVDGGPVQLAPMDNTRWNVSPRQVHLDNVIIKEGARTEAGGGIQAVGNLHLQVIESEITDNRAEFGAGLHARGTLTKVGLLNTRIAKNIAEVEGGGIACGRHANIVVEGDEAIEAQ